MSAARWLLAAAAAAALLAPAPPSAQTCGRCKEKGVLPCSKHVKGDEAAEERAIFCSVASRCANCLGAFEVDCPDCHLGEEKELEEQRNDLEQRIAKQAAFEKEMGGAPRATIRTAHFDLTFEVESMTVGRKPLGQHELLHLYSDRMEKLFTDFCETLQVKPRDFVKPFFRVYVWRSALDQKEASLRYAQNSSVTGVKLLGAAPVFSVLRDRNLHAQDDDLHRSLVHNVTHLFTSNLYDGIWLGQRKAGWVDEGLAHWFEDRGFGECTNFCYQEQNTMVGFRGGKWRQPVRGMAESGKRPPFPETAAKTNDELTLEEHALAFSYVDYLLARDAAALGPMIRALQKKKPTREALDQSYGISMNGFDELWSKWVLETYAKR